MKKPVVLLIQPPVYDFALFDLYLKPLGLLRLGRWFEKGGYTVNFVNGLDFNDKETTRVLGKPRRNKNGTGKFHRLKIPYPEGIKDKKRRFARYGVLHEVLKEKIYKSRPDIILVTSGMTYWYKGVVETTEIIRSLYRDVPLVVGGIYATLMPEHCLKVTGADLVVQGDGEMALKKFLRVRGLPVPAGYVGEEVLMLQDVWHNAGVLRLNYGCPYHCDYCASSAICGSFSSGSAAKAFNILKEMRTRFGTSNFAFYDDALLIQKESVLIPFLERVIDADFGVSFYLPNAIHLQFMDLSIARLMKKAGFREIRLGYESSSSDFHKKYDDKYTPGEFPFAVECLKSAGFRPEEITVYILAGLPGQEYLEVEESVRHAASFKVKVSIAEYSPVPGTELWDESVKRCALPLEREPLYHNNTFFSMEWEKFTSENMKYLKNLALEFNKGLIDPYI